jgi:hypothetical protein
VTDYPHLGFDPAPGNLAVVDDLQMTVTRVASTLSMAHDALQGLGHTQGAWQGLAAQAFTRRVADLPKSLHDASSSMTDAARALDTWSGRLADFRRRAAQYEQEAAQAAGSVSAARSAANALTAPGAAATPAQVAEAQHQATQAQARVAAASAALSDVLSRARTLLGDHEQVAREVAQALRAASSVAPSEPGFFSRIAHQLAGAVDFVTSLPGKAWTWVEHNADLIAKIGDVLSDISTVLGVVATICLFIPPLEVASGVLFAVSAGFAAGALVTHAVAKAGGADVSWGTLAVDAVGTLTWGAGKVATTGMQNAEAMYKTGVALHAATGFETGYEVLGAAAFLRYARVAKTALVVGASGLAVGTWNPLFGNVVDDAKHAWHSLTGDASENRALGATFLAGVGGGRHH